MDRALGTSSAKSEMLKPSGSWIFSNRGRSVSTRELLRQALSSSENGRINNMVRNGILCITVN
jgi:hypothetical protein